LSGALGCRPLGPIGWGIVLGSGALATGASLALPHVAPGLADWVVDVTASAGCPWR